MAEAARRRVALQTRRVCRFCLSEAEPLSDIYGESCGPVPLPLQVMACVAIEAFPSDGMPATICNMCRHFMDQSYRFKQICKQADEALRRFITTGEMGSPIEWPSDMMEKLPDPLKSISRPVKVEIPQAHTPEITYAKPPRNKTPGARPVGRPRKKPKAEDIIVKESEKIKTSVAKNDGIDKSDILKSSKIKVTQHGDEVVIDATEVDESDEFLFEEEIEDSKDQVPTGVFPCPHCERSFPLQQARDIHVKYHQRERTFPCTTCTSSFYTKYDLQKHEEIHTGVKSFHCSVCGKSFLRLTLLQRHEKTHTTVPKFLCSQCDQTFLTTEQLAMHNARRHSKERRFACEYCPKKFAFKQGLDRHCLQHAEVQPFECNYCDLSFSTPNRLMRHIQTHAGMRPYPCKFCSKSFLLSHHYTRHLRSKHMSKTKLTEIKKKTPSTFVQQNDAFKCTRCDEVLGSQDDLIYHSAVHATQDLICPLCKEKFNDVDAVTTHIKSHIDGEQFMCEYCELVFTAEDKLDMHIDSEHQNNTNYDDVYNEISFLEKQLMDNPERGGGGGGGGGGDGEHSTEEENDEEDELYESTQQAEANEPIKIVDDSEKTPGSEIEIEIADNGEIKINSNTEEENKLSYTELKTVNASEINKKPTEIVQKQLATGSNTTSLILKVEETKKPSRLTTDPQIFDKKSSSTEPSLSIPNKVIQSTQNISLIQDGEKTREYAQKINELKKRTNDTATPKIKIESNIEITPPRSNEKSLRMLEKDILELKKNAKSGITPEKSTSNRFLAYKSTLPRREMPYKSLKSTENASKTIKNSVGSAEKTSNADKTPRKNVSEKNDFQSEFSKQIRESTKEVISESSLSDADYSDNDSSQLGQRRSTRPNKVKDYAALIRDGGDRQAGSDSENYEEEDEDSDENEYKPPTLMERRAESVVPKVIAADGTVKRKRGRPRKHPQQFVNYIPPEKKQRYEDLVTEKLDSSGDLSTPRRRVGRPSNKALAERAALLGITVEELKERNRSGSLKNFFVSDTSKPEQSEKPSPEPQKPTPIKNTWDIPIKSPSGQMLKKIPAGMIKTLPPGVRPLPLPPGSGVPPGVCQMKIGEKVVRVQKIIMTKAEVDAITKKGLIEMKDGAMVLKAGVKLPTSAVDNKVIKSTLLSDDISIIKTESTPGPSQQPTTPALATSTPMPQKGEASPKPTRFADDTDDEDN